MKCPGCGAEAKGNFCEHCGCKLPQKTTNVSSYVEDRPRVTKTTKKQGVLLGFRSNKGWKKFLSILYLIFCGMLALSAFSGGRQGQVTMYDYVVDKVWRMTIVLLFLSPYIFLSNTKFRDVLPLFKRRNAGLSFVGMIIVVFAIAFLGGSITSLHSEEYQADMDNHAYVVVSTEGNSCTSEVVASMECEYCGKTTEETIPASGHELVEQSRVEPDCTTAGSVTSKCANCNEVITEPVAALGHDLEVSSQVDATCSSPGQRVGKCNVCGENVTEEIPQLSHKLEEVSRVDATDYEDGEVVSKCENCGEEIVEVLPCLIPRGSKENPHIFEPQVLFDLSVDGESQKPYFEQWVNITGTVLSISDYGELKGYYLVGGPGNGVVCWVDGGDTDVQYGQAVNFIGKISVADTKHIEINECEIVSVSWPEEKQKSPVTISGWRYTIDYVGGVEWNFKLTNNTDKEIKYVSMEWYCYNAVGDLVRCEITGKSSHSVRYTGPLGPGQTSNTQRNTTLFYNHSYKSAKLTKLQVEFMDGTIINVTSQGYSDIIKD